MNPDLSISLQSIKNLFSFPFRAARWQEKFLIGCALMFGNVIVPVLPWLATLGYGARLIRDGAENRAPGLPEWDEWGELLVDGLRLLGVSLIVNLPVIVVMFGGWFVYLASAISLIAASESRYGGQEDPFGFLLGMLILFLAMGIGMLLSIFTSLLLPPVMAHVAVRRRFGALFEFGSWWRVLRANLGGFIVALILWMGLYMVMMLVMQITYMTIILCWLLPFLMAPFMFYILVVFSRVIGQAYGDGLSALAGQEPAADIQLAAEIQPAADERPAADEKPADDLLADSDRPASEPPMI